ncbi:MAG: septation regulator SpoVG [Candidatus Mcinerneyibacterium aminivorans]|jgi:stage V sporulation protein G|uniref:Putative septation protein SpoVG n=1 Tax=Candidatus Mcinerneyibacterium aminivorans TaxID=2703815 RepID=A0A5D0MHS1_9BACT|nr:MAG: septation regulator SpoVG [Candidatus Mcinerneyibacterium aminivorans]
MEITDVRIYLRDNEKLKAFVTVTFDDDFVVRGMKVIDGNKGRFVAMPSRRRNDGTFQDIAHPINNDMREYIEEKVFKAYDEAVEKRKEELESETAAGPTAAEDAEEEEETEGIEETE